jgi:hypothetical protein
MRPEERIEFKVVEVVWHYLGILGSKLNVLGDTGWPDRVFWLPGGKPLLIEFKQPGGELEPKQIEIHAQLRRLGYDVQVHDNAAEAFSAVIDAVDTPRLPKESRQILTRARRGCAVLRSWAG